MDTQVRCIIHGSFRQHYETIQSVYNLFIKAGIDVLAPKDLDVTAETDGFVFFAGEEREDPRVIELRYLHHLLKLGQNGFSCFVNPDGYLGRTASYELGIAQATNTPCFFMAPLKDHPAYVSKRAIWSPQDLAGYIAVHGRIPQITVPPKERNIFKMWEKLLVPGSTVAVGAIIEYQPRRRRDKKEVLLVKTHKWGGRYSVVGEKVRRNERLNEALIRGIREETGLKAEVGQHLCTFDQIKNSGYYQPWMHQVFVDKVAIVRSKNVTLDEEAQEHAWLPADEALKLLPLEPNARHTLELYAVGQQGP